MPEKGVVDMMRLVPSDRREDCQTCGKVDGGFAYLGPLSEFRVERNGLCFAIGETWRVVVLLKRRDREGDCTILPQPLSTRSSRENRRARGSPC